MEKLKENNLEKVAGGLAQVTETLTNKESGQESSRNYLMLSKKEIKFLESKGYKLQSCEMNSAFKDAGVDKLLSKLTKDIIPIETVFDQDGTALSVDAVKALI